MEGWITKTIGDLCNASKSIVKTGPFGSQLHQSDYQDEGTPVVMPSNIINWKIDESSIARVSASHVDRLHKHKLSKNDIVYGRRGDIGRQAMVKESQAGWLCGTGCLRITLKDSPLEPPFLHYYLQMPEIVSWIENQAIGATMPNLNTEILKRVPVSYPENKNTQRVVTAILFAYDELIEKNNRRIAILEKMAEEIYQEWFVRMRFPGHEKFKIVKGVPEGWGIKKLNEVADITYGFPFNGSRFNSEGIGNPIIRIRNIPDSSITDFTDEHANEKYIIKKGDLLIGMDGEFHINHWYSDDAYLVQRTCKIEAKDPIHKGYLAKAIYAPVKFFESILQGATVGHLGAKHLNSIDIIIPPNEIDISIFNQLLEQKVRIASSNNLLRTFRDRLLTRLMSGKLDVENLDIRFPKSMEEKLA